MLKKTKVICALILAGIISCGVQACGIRSLFQKKNVVEDTIRLDAVSVLNADLTSADITIRQGSENSLYYKMDEDHVPEITQENGTLTVKKKSTFSISWFSFTENKLEITLDSKTLESLDISLTSGDIDVDGLDFGGTIQTTSGDISVSNAKNGGTLTLEATSGEISVRDSKFQSIHKEQCSGDTQMERVEAAKLYLQSTSGETTISKAKIGNAEISCTSGDTELELIGSESDYNYSCSCTSGTIRIADTKAKKNYEQDNHADHTFTADMTSGDLTVRFSGQ